MKIPCRLLAAALVSLCLVAPARAHITPPVPTESWSSSASDQPGPNSLAWRLTMSW